MGCDIHAFIERKQYEHWSLFGKIHLDRNYKMFGLMAGVRGGKAMLAPRGVPSDMAIITYRDYVLYISDETVGENYATAEEARNYISYGHSRMMDAHSVSHPDWHTPSWLMLDELKMVADELNGTQYESKELKATIAAMGELGESRLVFWFDN